ncbi:LysE family translocator [Anaeromyxobacter paludicola]|uniref:RhtB family transporter n=1 Tax=Anaeromyxobacter paludicola TaxID=2918171 RepID=A0ABM7X582_9BACT|nr:LysE family translocator [Anaeromyxobacter paludicola]BDG06972.1 RhtB family transporter [Anaeromyxobacter paludicola]
MLSSSAFLLFTLAAGALIVVPGPAVTFIVARSLQQGRRAGLISAMGIASGGLVHVAAAVLGLSALLASSAVAFGLVRWGGAAYLVYLGLRVWLSRPAAAEGEPVPAPARRLFAQGFLVNLLNPKTAIFFLAFLPQFADPSRGRVPLQLLLLGAWFVALAVASDCTYALLAGAVGDRIGRSPAARRGARLLSGGVYVALGLGTLLAGARAEGVRPTARLR